MPAWNYVPVLRDVELDVPSGRITVLMVAPGVGKTVVVKHIVGSMTRDDDGAILIDDIDAWSGSAPDPSEP